MVKRTTKHERRNYQGTEFNRTGNNKNQKISIWDDYKETIKKVKPNKNTYSMAILEVQRQMDDCCLPIKCFDCNVNTCLD